MKAHESKILGEGLTYDDVLLVPAFSEILPREVNIQTKFTKNITINIPVVSAAMDTVTESKMAIAMAQEGGISMIGLDARYAYKRFTARGQFIHANISDTEDYNALNGADLGSGLQGWYLEGAYNLLPQDKQQQLFAFARYSDYDTHASVAGGLIKNDAYDRDEWTFGLSYKLAPGAIVKADYQLFGDAKDSDKPNQLNIGLGVWF